MVRRYKRDGKKHRLHAPNGIHILESTDISVESVVLEHFPKFVLRVQFCKQVQIHNVTIFNIGKSIGTNGIVVDSSVDVHVAGCTIATGDKEDAIVVKAGEGAFPLASHSHLHTHTCEP